MGKLSTKNVKTEGAGGLSKTIVPGNVTCKINNVLLDQPPFLQQDNGYFLVLNLETEPIEGFEGFFINKDDESLGRHEGQVGRVKASTWAFKDGTTRAGSSISRDQEILKFMKNLCDQMGTDWFIKADNKHETIEDFIDAFNKAIPPPDTIPSLIAALVAHIAS